MKDTMNILKGLDGERTVFNLLSKIDGIVYIDDIYLSTSSGTTQIDGVVLSTKGIFVVEVKNIGGEVRGVVNSETWVNIQGGREFKFYNPILQNTGHIRHLKRELNYDGVMNNLIVFPDSTPVQTTSDRVVSYRDLENYFNLPDVHAEEFIIELEKKIREIKKNNEYLFFDCY